MPMAFGSLLGGIVTLVGTSPNIIVSRVRAGDHRRAVRHVRFHAGRRSASRWPASLFLAFGWRLLPRGRKGAALDRCGVQYRGLHDRGALSPEIAPGRARRSAELEAMSEGEVTVIDDHPRAVPALRPAGRMDAARGRHADAGGRAGGAGARSSAGAGLELVGTPAARDAIGRADEVGVMEAVVTPNSPLIGSTASPGSACDDRFGVNLLAVSRSGERITQRLRAVKLRAGDVVVLQGDLHDCPTRWASCGCLPLAERDMRLGARPAALCLPPSVLGIAMVPRRAPPGAGRDRLLRRARC